MANPVVQTAMCQCSFGVAPTPLMVNSQSTVQTGNMPQATIMDNTVLPFGMCNNPGNPAVAAATAAAMGVLTPMPCAPVTTAPWAPGAATVLVCGKPLLNNSSKLTCMWGGVISIVSTPAMTTQTP